MWRAAGEEANVKLTAGVKQFADAAGAAVKLVADVMSFKGGEFDPTKTSVDFYRFTEFARFALASVKYAARAFIEMGDEARANLTAGVKAFADAAGAAVKLVADVMSFKGGDFDPDKVSVDFYRFTEFAREAVLSIRVAAKAFIAMGEDERTAIADGVKAFADVASAALGIVSAVMGISATADKLPDISVIDRIFAWASDAIEAVRNALGGMTADTAALVKAGAEAAGAVGDAIGSIVDGIMGVLGLGGTGLLASDPSRKGLGFMQKVRGRRADFLAEQLRDTVKRAVSAVVDALSGINVGAPDDPKIKALEQLGDAFSAIAEGLNDIATAKIPNVRQIAALLAAMSTLTGPGGLGGGAGAGGAGGGAGIVLSGASVTMTGGTLMTPPIKATATITTTPIVAIGGRTIETLATMVEEKLADSFLLGIGGP